MKPENVMIRPDGYAKILDFGLAKLREVVSDDAATLLKTAPGITMGTLSYMAPEQLRGGDVTAAADVFSLGVVLYEMIGGRRPFQGADATQVVAVILSAPPQPLQELRRDVPAKLETIVTKCLAKAAEERYQSAGEVVEALEQISREAMAAAVSGDRPAGSRATAVLLRTAAPVQNSMKKSSVPKKMSNGGA